MNKHEEKVLRLINADPEFQRLVDKSRARYGQFNGTLHQVKQLLDDDLQLQTELDEFHREQARRLATMERKRCTEAFRLATGRDPEDEADVLAGAVGLTLRRRVQRHVKEWGARLNGGMPRDRPGRPPEPIAAIVARAQELVAAGEKPMPASRQAVAEVRYPPGTHDRAELLAVWVKGLAGKSRRHDYIKDRNLARRVRAALKKH